MPNYGFPIQIIGLASAYSTIPLHRQTGVDGKIIGQLLVAKSIRNCIPVIHGPTGCAFHRKINTLRPWDLFYDTPCSRFTEVEAIYGGNEKLAATIKEVYEKYKPDLIMIISTCASDITGDDFEDIVSRLKNEIQCEIVYTTGTATERRRMVGVQDALYSIVDQLLEISTNEKIEKSVNLTASPSFPPPKTQLLEFASMLEKSGVKVVGIYFGDNSVSELKKIPLAEMNIVPHPQSWAELVERRYGSKTFILSKLRYKSLEEAPYGIEGTKNLLIKIADEFNLGGEAEEVANREYEKIKDDVEKHRKRLKGVKVSLEGPYLTDGLVMLRELGMKCSVLILRFSTSEKWLTKSAIKRLEKLVLDFILSYQDDEPEILVDPLFDEELSALKRNKVDLVVPGYKVHPARYTTVGLKVFIRRFLRYYGYSYIGFKKVLDLAKDVELSLKGGIGDRSLLSMLEYSQVWPRFDKHWERLVSVFQKMWYYDVPPEPITTIEEERRKKYQPI